MPGPCILISSQLNLHREVLQGVLQAQRPHLDIHAVAPADLDGVSVCRSPRLVICSDEDVIRRTAPFAWILLYPDDQNLAQVGIGNDSRTLPGASMEELVGIIDEVWSLPIPADH